MKQSTGNQICILCRRSPPIQNSHILPKLVIKWIKNNAPVAHFRWSARPNKPEQDAWTADYLCGACEQRLSRVENTFKQEIFNHAVARAAGTFSYGHSIGPAVLSMFFRHLRFIRDVQGNGPPSALDELRSELASSLDGNPDWPALYMAPLAFETRESQTRLPRVPGYNQ